MAAKDWQALGPAVSDVVKTLVSMGLPDAVRGEVADLIWELAKWQGDREYRNAKVAFAQQITDLAMEQYSHAERVS